MKAVKSVANQAAAGASPLRWIQRLLLVAFAIIALLALYALSLGPALRIASTTTTVTRTNAVPNGELMVQETTLAAIPAWVGVTYYPLLAGRDGEGSMSRVYRRYLEWWKAPAPSAGL